MRILAVLYSLLMAIGTACAAESELRAWEFTLLDQHGEPHQMSRYNSRKAIVLLTISSECSISPEILRSYSQIQSRFLDLGFEFVLLNFSPSSELDGVSLEKTYQAIGLPILMDENQLLSKSLGVSRTNEVLVFDPKNFKVIYRGAADSNLVAALFTILAGEELMNSIGNESGCEINHAPIEAN